MPMIVYTEEELIAGQEMAAADAVRDVAEQRDRAMCENTVLRRKLNDLRDVTKRLLESTELLVKEVTDPGTEALAAIHCAHAELLR